MSSSVDPPLFNMSVLGWVMAASLTLLAYDYLCTLRQEVDYVWSCPWMPVLLLFFLNRYLPFVDQVVLLHLQVSVNSRQACLIQNTLAIVTLNIGSAISQSIIILRTIAIWGSHRRVQYALVVVAICTWIVTISMLGVLLASIEYSPSDFPSRGCSIARATQSFYGLYITIFIVETLIVTLTAIKAFSHVRQSNSSWVAQLYRDGLFFCGCLLFITLINVVVPRFSFVPLMYKGVFSLPQRALHSVFCNRVMLQILKYRTKSSPPLTPGPHSRSAYESTLGIFTSIQPVTSYTTDGVALDFELDSASTLEREG